MISLPNIKPKILVIGDLIIDHYLWGSSDRISPEAPVPVVNINNESIKLGGAGNVVKNLYSLGATVDIISVIGECEASNELKDLLSDINISTQYLITQKDRITSKKSRVIASHQQVARYDVENTDEISDKSQIAILEVFKNIITNYDIVLLSDYGKGVLTLNLSQSFITIANENNKKLLVDPKGLDYSKYKGAYLLTPNKKEAGEATRTIIKDLESLTKAALILKEQYNLEYSLIILSEEGVAIFDSELRIYPTRVREVFDVTGAGDTILASLGYALSYNNDIDAAVKFANLASGIVVSKIGSATATVNEIINYDSSFNSSTTDSYIKTWSEISFIVKDLKNKNKKIIFTNGCFDILHIGHVKYLEESKSFGDILILGLNSDDSVRRLKGENRPINTEDDRAYILASIEAIDYVVIFDNDTPFDLINLIQPDILVKGADYEGKEIVGEDIAKEIKLVKFIDERSTTRTVAKIQKLKRNY